MYTRGARVFINKTLVYNNFRFKYNEPQDIAFYFPVGISYTFGKKVKLKYPSYMKYSSESYGKPYDLMYNV